MLRFIIKIGTFIIIANDKLSIVTIIMGINIIINIININNMPNIVIVIVIALIIIVIALIIIIATDIIIIIIIILLLLINICATPKFIDDNSFAKTFS